MKRCISLVLAALMAITAFPTPALAAYYSAASGEEMSHYWQEASGNEDGTNFFTLTDDVDMSGHELIAADGKIYTVTAEAGSDYSMSNVIIGADEPEGERQGSIIYINADVTGDDQTALMVSGETNVYITGDVSVVSESSSDPADLAIIAASGANVNVHGDVTSEESGIHAFGAQVGVEGDVTLLAEGKADAENYVLFATDGSDIYVGGSVTSEEGGIYVTDSGTEISVDGDVITEGQTTVYDNGGLDIGGDLICNPTGADTGVTEAIFVYSGALTVEGDVKTPELYVSDSSSVKISGDVRADSVYIGSYGETSDKTEVSCQNMAPHSDALLNTDCSVVASGASHTTVYGHIRGELWADTEARVDVSGNVAIIRDVADKAVVNTGLGFGANQGTILSDTHYGEDIQDPLAALCIGYTPGSSLFTQTLSLESLLGQVSADMTAEMNFLSALAPAISLKDEIIQQDLMRLRDGVLGVGTYINSGSLDLLESALTVSGYDVSLYMNNLHEVLKNSEDSIQDNYDECLEEASVVSDIFEDFFKMLKGLEGSISPEQMEYLKEIFETGDFTVADANNFLVKFGYFDGDIKKIVNASQTMHEMFKFFKEIENVAEVADKIFIVIDFADYWVRNYGAAARLLDNMLSEQTLSPAMLLATVKLREEYRNKITGTFRRADDLIMEGIWDKIEAADPLYLLVDTTVDLVALATGLTKTGQNLMNATALTGITPSFLTAYKNSILRVQNGDHSKEALALVRTNYSILISFLDAMCETMSELGDTEQVAKYKDIREQLADLEIGTSKTIVF